MDTGAPIPAIAFLVLLGAGLWLLLRDSLVSPRKGNMVSRRTTVSRWWPVRRNELDNSIRPDCDIRRFRFNLLRRFSN